MLISSAESERVREMCRRLSETAAMPPEIIMFAAFESMINRVSLSPSPGSSRMANDDKDGSVQGFPLSRGAHLPTRCSTYCTLLLSLPHSALASLTSEGVYVSLTYDELDASKAMARVKSPKAGAVVLFAGCTRDSFASKTVTHLAYSTYAPLALRSLLSIAKDIRSKHDLVNIAVTHRLGRVDIGEESILIAVSAPHRKAGWTSGEECLERVKQRVEIWKEEWFEDGGVWRSNRDGAAGMPVKAYRALTFNSPRCSLCLVALGLFCFLLLHVGQLLQLLTDPSSYVHILTLVSLGEQIFDPVLHLLIFLGIAAVDIIADPSPHTFPHVLYICHVKCREPQGLRSFQTAIDLRPILWRLSRESGGIICFASANERSTGDEEGEKAGRRLGGVTEHGRRLGRDSARRKTTYGRLMAAGLLISSPQAGLRIDPSSLRYRIRKTTTERDGTAGRLETTRQRGPIRPEPGPKEPKSMNVYLLEMRSARSTHKTHGQS
ncbi:hypothetical protein KC345_g79 [Hortaea werneckii]|nr:hypothetical protein KC345_g79 [Hortaea werneckii]